MLQGQRFRVTKSEASEIAAHMQTFGCQAVITDSVCHCVDAQQR